MLKSKCRIVDVGKRRDGGTRYWCIHHRADATAKYGKPADKCRYADIPEVLPEEQIVLDLSKYKGGIGLWGAVPPIYDTSTMPIDRGVHVHARETANGDKCIDRTYRKVTLTNSESTSCQREISELDAIYYMISSVFGYPMKNVECGLCGVSHLDKDWFSLHPHHRHLCSGCGKYFRDDQDAIGNPLIGLQKHFGHQTSVPTEVDRTLEIKQNDFPGGIQIWGSNPAIFWTNPNSEESGIHVHIYDENGVILDDYDNTYSRVVIDGIDLDAKDVQRFMAQNILPHISGRVVSLSCPECGGAHRSSDTASFTPSEFHQCSTCGKEFRSRGRRRRLISNPIVQQLEALERHAPRLPQKFDLGLLPETL